MTIIFQLTLLKTILQSWVLIVSCQQSNMSLEILIKALSMVNIHLHDYMVTHEKFFEH